MRWRRKQQTYTPEIVDLHLRLMHEIEDLTGALARYQDINTDLRRALQEAMNLLDKYNKGDIQTTRIDRNPIIVKKARRNLKDVCVCAYCSRLGTDTDPDGKTWHMDHIIPLSKGGQDSLSNIVKTCQYCNLKKGAKHLEPVDGAIKADGNRYTQRQKEKAA